VEGVKSMLIYLTIVAFPVWWLLFRKKKANKKKL
jgi:hypothetical protein